MDASYCLCVLLFGKQIHEPISLQGDTFLWFYPVFLSSCSVMLSRCASRGYTVYKRREPEHDNPSQFYARVQSPGRLRGLNGSQERKPRVSALSTEARSRLSMEGPVSGRSGHGLL